MKKGKLSADDRAHARLLDFWQHRPEYGDPIGCVTTTYTFDAAFFEEQCLGRFLGMDSDPDEDERSYLIEREEKLALAFAAVLVDQAHVPLARSLRWHALPVRVPEGGILHSKLSILVWERRVRVLVGSANMTAPGYRLNFENLAALDFGPEGGIPLSLLRDALALVDEYRTYGPGHDGEDGPQSLLAKFIRSTAARTSTWPDAAWPRGGASVALLPTGPRPGGSRRPSLFGQIRDLWRFPPPDEAWVMSPFFDDGDGALATTGNLADLLVQRGERALHFIVSGRELPDGILELDLPACLAVPTRPRLGYHAHRVSPEGDDALRPLHAKSLWLRRGDQALHCIGSSNFTAAGTGCREAGRINLEVNLAFVLPDLGDEVARACERAYPPIEAVDLDDEVRFLQPGDRTPEPEGYALLPAGFGAALLLGGTPNASVALELRPPLPAGFVVSTDDGDELLTETAWRAAGCPARLEIAWTRPRPPSHLLVTWQGPDGPCTAVWTVNVSDPSALPPPEELRSLTLDDLVDVLSSARPAHEVLARILRRRREGGGGDTGPETDPHRKVDTRNFLLKRMRRVSAALEELRGRLEKPVYSREALAWRIAGPFGPLALADRLVVEEAEAASFFLAEVALTLRSVTPRVQGDLTQAEATAALDAAIERLATLARAHPAPANLAAYVAEIFAPPGEEVRP